ncbi:ABC transporter ATP-binding protein [Salipiger sp. PrR002]|uniref:ABC transporter ATP-binding protein n=1 Tax=Salipiger sp. PrR002 TaxID=2706489 RepID=UPI0013B8836E|nr:ABC transporter ATP-binding protein [Salipiger sp. PrR002]NDW02001.1 ABC transporter ATP-binding protein [Salipiger sp. PrR002]NDW59041.1 ABC transporter ATP-binding protein [Salipiger sp. PrR004]
MTTAATPLGSSETTMKLQARGLAKIYGPTVALDHVDLDVREGELLTLLGPSGSGKTTLLQLIAGLADPSAGQVMIDGTDQTFAPVNKRGIGVVFQNYALFPHMTVAENVAFPLKMRGMAAADIAPKVEKVLDTVGLGHAHERFPTQLSGGQQQRVALARCLVYDPSIILMDEPLGALDAKLREVMQIEIKRIHRETGATIIFVTHDQEEALALSDRICLMSDGKIAQIDTPRKIYAEPNSLFVADFIGQSTILKGHVEGAGLQTPLGLIAHGRDGLTEGAAGALVIRPEDIRLGEGDFEGRVIETVFAGSDLRVILEAAGCEITTRAPASFDPAIGEMIRFGWADGAARYVPDDAAHG